MTGRSPVVVARLLLAVRAVLAALALLASLGCLVGCSKGSTGPTSCTITDNGDGTNTVTCPDGSSITVPSGGDGVVCTLAVEADGTRTIACSDGTVVRLDAGGRPIFPAGGALTGVALLFGADDHEGTLVQIPATGQQTVTDSSGAWHLDDLPAGFHELRFEHEGYAPVVLPDVAALGEARAVQAVVLRRGVQLLDAPGGGYVVVSPAGDAALFIASGSGVVLWEQGTESSTRLAEGYATGGFSADGRSVALLETGPSGFGGELRVVDRATGRAASVATGVDQWQWGAGGAVLTAIENGGGGELQLVVFDVALAQRHVVGRVANSYSYELSDDGAFVLSLEADGRLVLHEVATGWNDLLAEGLPQWNGLRPSQLLPHGGGVLVVTDPEQDWLSTASLFELPGRTSRLLASRVDPGWIIAAGDGKSVGVIDVQPDGTSQGRLWDARRRQVSDVGDGTPIQQWSFSPDGTKLLVSSGAGFPGVSLEVIDLEQGLAPRSCPFALPVGPASFLGDQPAILFYDERGGNRLWELATDTVAELGGDRNTYPLLGPDPDLVALLLQSPGGNSVSLYSRSARSARLLGDGSLGQDLFFDPRGVALYSHLAQGRTAGGLVRLGLPGGEVEALDVGAWPDLRFPRSGSSLLVLGCGGACLNGVGLLQLFPGGEEELLDDHIFTADVGNGFVAYTVSGNQDPLQPARNGGFIAPLFER